MCIALLASKVHPDYPLIILSNRDEFYARPTKALHYWGDRGGGIYAGSDIKAGGSWFGINRQGMWALVTNYRAPNRYQQTALSRGKIITDFLSFQEGIEDFISSLTKTAFKFNPFNLLCGDEDNIFYYSSVKNISSKLEPGNIYALSNANLDTSWPKVVKAKSKFRELLISNNMSIDKYLEVLEDTTIAPDNELPNTGVSIEIERALSAIHIVSPEYGTCSAGVIQIDKNHRVDLWEKTYQHLDVPAGMVHMHFSIK
jgi:uncharacterized protein with NRDE domain